MGQGRPADHPQSLRPQVIEVKDVEEVDKAMVEEWFNAFPRVQQVDVIGGFPCVHLSAVRAGRMNAKGSKLFWNLVQLIKWVEEVFSPTAAVEFVVENVLSMDAEAREEISQQLGVEPLALCPSDVLPYNRPRLAWVSSAIEAGEGCHLGTPEWLHQGAHGQPNLCLTPHGSTQVGVGAVRKRNCQLS